MEDIVYIGWFALVAFVGIVIAMALTAQGMPLVRETISAMNVGAGENLNTTEATTAAETTETVMSNFDYVIPLFVILGAIVSFALAYYISVSPIFFPISLFYLMLVLGISYVISEIGLELLNIAENELALSFPLTSVIMGNWFMIAVVYGIIMLIATYAKTSPVIPGGVR